MSSSTATIPPVKALQLHSLITLTEQGASRVLAKTSGGNLTLFAFDAGLGLTEHTSPCDARALVLEARHPDDRRDRGSRDVGRSCACRSRGTCGRCAGALPGCSRVWEHRRAEPVSARAVDGGTKAGSSATIAGAILWSPRSWLAITPRSGGDGDNR